MLLFTPHHRNEAYSVLTPLSLYDVLVWPLFAPFGPENQIETRKRLQVKEEMQRPSTRET